MKKAKLCSVLATTVLIRLHIGRTSDFTVACARNQRENESGE